MSTTDNIELPESARRFHELYRSDLARVEPVSDAQILAAIDRAEAHDRNQRPDAGRWEIAAHLGFVHNSWTTRRLRPQIDALRSAGRIRNVRRCGIDLVALTATGRRALGKARVAGQVFLHWGRRTRDRRRLAGAQAVEMIPTRVETRRKLITPEQAAGPLWRHTLAVNDVGIAFLQAARKRGDDFGPLGWRHEIAHAVPAAGHARGELLIADALLTYLALGPAHELTFHYRLLELDRATVPTDTLASKLARYADLYRHAPTGRGQASGPAWQARYPIFPEIICVLTGQPRPALTRRAHTVLALCREDPQLKSTSEVRVSLALLEDLQAKGPFAAIWHQPTDPGQALDWLGGT